MSGNKLFTAALACMLFCSCAAIDTRTPELLETAQATSDPVKTAEVVIGSVSSFSSQSGISSYTDSWIIGFTPEMIGATVVNTFFLIGDTVNEGDVICEILYDQKAVNRSIEAISGTLEQLESNYEIDKTVTKRLRDNLSANAVDELGRLKLKKVDVQAEIAEKQYLEQHAALSEQLAEESNKLGVVPILSEASGKLISYGFDTEIKKYVSKDYVVTGNAYYLVYIAKSSDIKILVDCKREDYFYKKKVWITTKNTWTHSNAGDSLDDAEGYLVNNPFLIYPSANSQGVSIKTSPEVEEYYGSLNGRYRIVMQTFYADNGLIVPKEAVYTEKNRYYVYIVEGGMKRKRYIDISASNNTHYMVKDGLSEGQFVALN